MDIAIYSASTVDSAMDACVLEAKRIMPPPRKMSTPEMERRSPQLASVKVYGETSSVGGKMPSTLVRSL